MFQEKYIVLQGLQNRSNVALSLAHGGYHSLIAFPGLNRLTRALPSKRAVVVLVQFAFPFLKKGLRDVFYRSYPFIYSFGLLTTLLKFSLKPSKERA